MSVKGKRITMLAGLCITAGIIFYGALTLYPGPFRYRNLPEAQWSGDAVLIGEKVYTFYGPLEDGMKKGNLVAYVKDTDGYVTEFYSVRGDGFGWMIAKRRAVMGDMYLMQEKP